jgi:hypothetical protein
VGEYLYENQYSGSANHGLAPDREGSATPKVLFLLALKLGARCPIRRLIFGELFGVRDFRFRELVSAKSTNESFHLDSFGA